MGTAEATGSGQPCKGPIAEATGGRGADIDETTPEAGSRPLAVIASSGRIRHRELDVGGSVWQSVRA